MSHAETALARACQRLGHSASVVLDAEETSVFLQYWLASHLPTGRPSRRLAANALQRLSADPQAFLSPAQLRRLTWPPVGQALEHSATYRRRLLDLALETDMSRPLAPPVCLSPHPLAAPQAALVHAVVYAAAPLLAHEFYPLAVDAYARDALHRGASRFLVVAAHGDWVHADGSLRRALFCDWDRQRLLETDLQTPLRPTSAHLLCLGTDQNRRHQTWAARLACPLANPPAAAALADDKYATALRWREAGLDTPATHRIDSATDLQALLQRYGALALKPPDATESHAVALINTPTDLEHYRRASAGSFLVQARRDGVFYQTPQGARHTLVLRLNVCWDGACHRAESAYAQIGRDAASPAGGTSSLTLSLDEALAGLCRSDGAPVPWPASALARLRRTAEQAAAPFAGLLLIGIDIVLDLDTDDTPTPVLLEANARPAGLGHARLLADGQAGIAPGLWDGLEALSIPGRQPLVMDTL